MSADNGIYILPLRCGYYVSYCMGIDDLWFKRENKCYDPKSVVRFFSLGRSSNAFSVAHFNGETEAWEFARKKAAEWVGRGDILEYGVSMLDAQQYTMAEFKTMVAESKDVHDLLDELPEPGPMEDVCELPGGYMLYRQTNVVGGHTYFTDEIPGGTMVWDTCLCSESALLAAMLDQAKIRRMEYEAKLTRGN